MIDRVKNLEQAVAKLEESEFQRFATWFAAHQNRVWDRQIARDAKAGALDFLIEEARAEGAGARNLFRTPVRGIHSA